MYVYREAMHKMGSLFRNAGTICLNWEKGFLDGKAIEIVADDSLNPGLISPKSQVCSMLPGVGVYIDDAAVIY